jgi:hypothetical protein
MEGVLGVDSRERARCRAIQLAHLIMSRGSSHATGRQAELLGGYGAASARASEMVGHVPAVGPDVPWGRSTPGGSRRLRTVVTSGSRSGETPL